MVRDSKILAVWGSPSCGKTSDTEFKHKLGDFNMMQGFEYKEATVEAIESGIKRMIETDWSSYQLEIKTLELDRMKELLGNAVEYIKESEDNKRKVNKWKGNREKASLKQTEKILKMQR